VHIYKGEDVMENVRVWMEKVMIPSYELLEDDLNPIIEGRLDPYPYTMQNNRSETLENIEHEAIILENQYLKLMVLPNLGGRLFSAFDKINNREVFYRNAVIKPRMIGTRGAWFSGGVEFNFPISHSPTTMDRVNYLTKTYEDGSGAIEFGNIELISGMNWKVELRIYKDKAYIEQNVSLYNPTRNLNRFYFWTNAAVDFDKSVKLIYPFDWCINQIDPYYIKWPYYKGTDFSNLSEVPYAYETFGKIMKENFFGAYSMDKEYGVVHYADRKVLKGAKFFTWGNDDLAKAWNGALTEDDSEYLEIQSGPFETQMVYKFMKPHQQLKWSEYWYPVSNTEGFVHAGKEIAVNFKTKEAGIEVIFYAAEAIENCSVVLKARGKTCTKIINLACGKVQRELFQLGEPVNLGEFSLEVYGGGRHLISFGLRDESTDKQLDIELYEDSRVNRGENYKEKAIDCATFHESLGRTKDAIGLYKEQLAENPACTVTLNRLGSLYLKKALYSKGEECFKKVLSLDNRNGEARFMMASVQKEKGNYKMARRLFADIACDSEYYNASLIEFAKISIYLGFYKDAYDTLEANQVKSSYYDFLKSVALRKDSLGEATCLQKFTEVEEYILAEQFLLGQDKEAVEFLKYTKGDEKILIILALEYVELGLWEDASKLIGLLQKPGIKARLLKQNISIMLGTASFKNFEVAVDAPLNYVFINEKLLVKMLEKCHLEDSTGKADYLLGTYYHAMGREEEAIEVYLDSYQKGLRYTVLLRNMGLIYYNYKKDWKEAVKYLKEDIEINQEVNANSLSILYTIYFETQDLEGRKNLLPYMKTVKNKSQIMVQMVETLRDTEDVEGALTLLNQEEFENWEGIENSGLCYKETILSLAMKFFETGEFSKALAYIDKIDKFPKGLNFGNSIRVPIAKERYYKGRIYARNGLEQKAIGEFKLGALEAEKEELMHTSESREYARKCLDEAKKKV
jgi:tetratricopeptide (TPR) repeat protein